MSETMSFIEHQQQRGIAWDIIDEALADYDGWMLDDDYEATPVLQRIMRRMRERRNAFYNGGREMRRTTERAIAGLIMDSQSEDRLRALVREARRLLLERPDNTIAECDLLRSINEEVGDEAPTALTTPPQTARRDDETSS